MIDRKYPVICATDSLANLISKITICCFMSLCLNILICSYAYPAVFVVDNLGDVDDGNNYTYGDGTNTLRKCVRMANKNVFIADTIAFMVSGTINFGSSIELTDDDTIIDAGNQWKGIWPEGYPGITLDGGGTVVDGLIVSGANCEIKGFSIFGFTNNGITITGKSSIVGGNGLYQRNVISSNGIGIYITGDASIADYNQIKGNYIGTDVNGITDLGNSYHGIYIANGAQNNTIGGSSLGDRNIISGTGINGVMIFGPGTDSNKVKGNYIGTDKNGTADLGNLWGVCIAGGAQYNTIGGSSSGDRNVISGNDEYGVCVHGSGTNNNEVKGNYIGTDMNGTADLGNTLSGVYITYGAQSNTIGGSTAGDRNIISGNDNSGVLISGLDTNNNKVNGNHIGTDVNGIADLGNSDNGVSIADGAQHNTIGGSSWGDRNIISGNDKSGVFIHEPGTNNNYVKGNYIGTDVNGTAGLGNGEFGVCICSGAQNNIIGGSSSGDRNIISGNFSNGILIFGSGTDNNEVKGNYIGTDKNGTASLENIVGVWIAGGAQYNTIGGSSSGDRNIISSNGGGVHIESAGTNNNQLKGNYIGTDVNGTAKLGNGSGVSIGYGPQYNTIGGSSSGDRNIISGNDEYGVFIYELGTDNNEVKGNYIGTDVSGTAKLGNGSGVSIGYGPQYNIIGGSSSGDRNIISGNDGHGVYIFDTDSNVVKGNYIGTDKNGTADLGNTLSGVCIDEGAEQNTIGGSTSGDRNIISGNNGHGVSVTGEFTDNNQIRGNYIGTDVNGTADLGNSLSGVYICNFGHIGQPKDNIVGGSSTGDKNIISGNGGHGVYIDGYNARNNQVKGNYIGTDVDGTADLGNSLSGVYVGVGTVNNNVGGSAVGDRNIISGNDGSGIYIYDYALFNHVYGNYIGTDVNGTADLGNSLSGVYVGLGANHNIIGGSAVGDRNIISGNDGHGVYITGEDTENNGIKGNYIGTDVNGTADLGNSYHGIYITNGAQHNIIGG